MANINNIARFNQERKCDLSVSPPNGVTQLNEDTPRTHNPRLHRNVISLRRTANKGPARWRLAGVAVSIVLIVLGVARVGGWV